MVLRMPLAAELMQFIKYTLVGMVNATVGYSVVFAAMFFLGIGPEVSSFLGLSAGVACSFCLNRNLTFKCYGPVGRTLTSFVFVYAVCYLFSVFVLRSAIHSFRVNPYIAQFLSALVFLPFSFLGCKLLVFRSRSITGLQLKKLCREASKT
jgi:putative flippase GtrA